MQKLESKAEDWIAQHTKGSVNREFPGQTRNKTLDEIRKLARQGDAVARKAWKLVNDDRFLK